MNQITIDGDLKNQVNGLNQLVEIRDADGTVLGQFLPADFYKSCSMQMPKRPVLFPANNWKASRS